MRFSLGLVVLVLWSKANTYYAAGSTVRMMNSSLSVSEGSTVSVCVVATLGTNDAVGVKLTSNSDQDLTLPTDTLMLDNTTLTGCWDITADDDSIYEDDIEMVTLSLMIVSESGGVILGTPMNTVVSVTDNDEVTVQMANSMSTVNEGQSVSVCAVSGTTIEREVTVRLVTTQRSGEKPATSGLDYQNSTMEGTFTASVSQVCLSVQAIAEDPVVYENFEVFDVTLSVVNPTANSRVRVGTATTTVQISDRQRAGVSMRDTSITQNEGDGNVEVCAQLVSPAGGSEKEIFISLTKSDNSPSDFTFSSNSPVGTTKCLTYTVVDDDQFEQSPLLVDTVTLSTTSVQGRVDLTSTTTTIRVNDDDDVMITLQNPTSLSRAESDSIEVCAALTSPSGGIQTLVTVQLTVTLGTGGDVTFPAMSSMGATRCSSITDIDNDVYEDNRQLAVQLTSQTPRVAATGSATFTITDDDDATVSMVTNTMTQDESAGNVRVCARLDSPSGGVGTDVTVVFTTSSSQGAEMRTFLSGSPQGSMRCIDIEVVDNLLFQASLVAMYMVTLTASDPRVSVAQNGGTTSVIINDDDDVTITIPSSISQDEGAGGVRVCPTLASPSGGLAMGQLVRVTLTATGQQPGTMDVTFPPRSGEECVTYSVMNDQVYESSPVLTFTVALSTVQPRVTATGTSMVTVNDDDDPVLALQQHSYSLNETTPEVSGDICVTLEGPAGGLAESVQVQFTISTAGFSRPATPNVDFNASSLTQTMEFTASDSVGAVKCITVRIVDDDIADPDENFRVTVTTPLTARAIIRGGSVATVTIINNDFLPPPTNLVMTGVSSRSVDLSWDSPESSSFSIQLTGYTISWNSGSRSVEGTTTAVSISNLVPNQHYQFSVHANFGEDGFGESISIDVTTHEDVPTPPTDLTLSFSAATSLTLSWSEPAQPNGVITHYTLYTDYRNGSNSVHTTSSTEYTLSPLSPYQTVSVQLSANTSVGEGPRTTIVKFITDEAKSDPVSKLTANRVNSSILRVEWSEPAAFNGVFQTYSVQISTEGRSAVQLYNTTVSRLTISGLAPYIPYEVSVSAVNGAGVGETQSIIEFTEEGVPISHPRDITVTRVNATTANVSWTPLTLTEARGFITEYNITYHELDSSNMTTINVSSIDSFVIITGLKPGSQYSFMMSANTAVGASNTSSSVMLTPYAMISDFPAVIVAGVAVGAVVVVVLLVLIICIACTCMKRKQHSQKYAPQKVKPLPPPKPKRTDIMELDMKAQEAKDDFDDEVDTSFLLPEKEVINEEAISVVDFSRHVKDLHRDTSQGFEKEYKSIKDGDHSTEISQLPYNKFKKNRFTNIFPFDYCRVKLQSTGKPGSDYINASWLNGYKKENAYIAAQGPLPETVEDFWRMIWENKLQTIVMVTKLVENAREKCQQYWPKNTGEVMEVGPDICVTLMEVKRFTDYEIRLLSATNETDPDAPPFLLTHFYYLGWPDHGVPEYATSLLGFLRRVRKTHPVSGPPLLVHCSAGVGRTGTFIVLDAMLQQIQAEKTVNVYRFVKEMRERRCQMVQTMSQYVFIHDALNELISCGDTEVVACNLNIAINQLAKKRPGTSVSGFEEQFQLLEQVSRTPTRKDYDNMENLDVEQKNRYPNRFPYDGHRPRLNGSSKQEQYINASFIDGYKQRRCFVATQAPLPNTVLDLWKMVWKLESRTIVMLCDLVEDCREVSALYWPDRLGEEVKYGKIIIKLLSEEQDKGVIKRKLELAPIIKVTSSDSYVLTLFHFPNWNENGTQPSPESVIHLNELVVNSQKSTGNKPIVVMCNDGCGRTGTFLSVYSTIDRFKVEAVVDVFQCVKAARIQRMALVGNIEQYTLIYDALKQYMMSFDQYANFTDVI